MKRSLIAALLAFATLGAHAAQFARPYVGAGPTDVPAAYGNTIQSVYLVDPVSGVPVSPSGGVSGGATGLSASGTIGATSGTIVTANQFPRCVTIQNTHATNTLYVSFNATTTAANGHAIAPGASLTLTTGFSNVLTGIGSAAGTTYSLIGF